MGYKRISPQPVVEGGTGVASNTAYAVLCGGTTATGAIQSIAGVGTSGQILTSNGASALPTFQDVAGGGDFILLQTVNASAASSVTLSTGISATYDNYVIIATWAASGTDTLILQIADSGGTRSTGYTGSKIYITDPTTGPTWATVGSLTTYMLSMDLASSSGGGNAWLNCYNCTNATRNVVVDGWCPQYVDSGNPKVNYAISEYGSVTTVTGFVFSITTSTVTGRFSLYGLKYS